MKKTISVFLCITILILSGCTNTSKIRKLEEDIKEIDNKIELKQYELKQWQNIYEEAKGIYYAPHSSNSEVQKELQKIKEMKDDAEKKVNSLTRDIDLMKLERDLKEKDIDELKKG